MQRKALLMGGSGFIGSAIAESLVAEGWHIHLLTRNASELRWHTSFPCSLFEWDKGEISPAALNGVTAVINLVGQPIADKSWTQSYKSEIFNSRINAVKALKRALIRDRIKPQVIIQASAIGYYGFDQSGELNEASPAGSGFLSETCQIWEKEAQGLSDFSRLCIARIGLVLGWGGGAFPKLHDVYCFGLGATLGKGNQWMNWIHIADVVNFVRQAILQDSYNGIFNLVSPEGATNKEFHKELSKYTCSFSATKAPKAALKFVLGQRAALVLKGSCIRPKKLQNLDFEFQFPSLNACLGNIFYNSIHTEAHVLEFRQWLPVSSELTWEFIANAENLEKITPSWLQFKVLKRTTEQLGTGSTIDYELKLHGLSLKWRSLISHWQPPHEFVDEQISGPYKSWHHRHLFSQLADGILIVDRVEYRIPFFPFGELAFPFIKKDLLKIFKFRQKKMAKLMVSNGQEI